MLLRILLRIGHEEVAIDVLDTKRREPVRICGSVKPPAVVAGVKQPGAGSAIEHKPPGAFGGPNTSTAPFAEFGDFELSRAMTALLGGLRPPTQAEISRPQCRR
jgi:hypothetical protein